jgi:hypothetical protein
MPPPGPHWQPSWVTPRGGASNCAGMKAVKLQFGVRRMLLAVAAIAVLCGTYVWMRPILWPPRHARVVVFRQSATSSKPNANLPESLHVHVTFRSEDCKMMFGAYGAPYDDAQQVYLSGSVIDAPKGEALLLGGHRNADSYPSRGPIPSELSAAYRWLRHTLSDRVDFDSVNCIPMYAGATNDAQTGPPTVVTLTPAQEMELRTLILPALKSYLK